LFVFFNALNGYYDALGCVVRMFESMRKDLENFIQYIILKVHLSLV